MWVESLDPLRSNVSRSKFKPSIKIGILLKQSCPMLKARFLNERRLVLNEQLFKANTIQLKKLLARVVRKVDNATAPDKSLSNG